MSKEVEIMMSRWGNAKIELKDGRIFEGEVLDQSPEYVHLKYWDKEVGFEVFIRSHLILFYNGKT